MKSNLLIVAGLYVSLLPPGAALAAPQWSAGTLYQCAAEPDDAKRLACFDAEAERVGPRQTEPVSEAVAAGPAAAPPAPPPLTKEEEFGLRGDLKQEKMPQLQELEATVTEVQVKPRGELVVTLDNGQAWSEIAPYSGIRVKVGDRVTIKAGALSSFVLVAPNRRSSKVTRVR